MTNTKTPHTPEPWFVVNDGTESEPMMSIKAARISGQPPRHEVALCATGDSPQEMENANARRIVACVNACAGVSTEELEKNPIVTMAQHEALYENKTAILTELNLANEQREELLAAAKLAVLNFERTNHGNPDRLGDDDFEAWTALNKAIAKCEVSHGT